MTARRAAEVDALLAGDRRDELGIFVPVLMSAGLVFSLVTLLQDAVHHRRWRAHHRRTSLVAATLVEQLRSGEAPRSAIQAGVLPRAYYVGSSLVSLATAIVLAVGSTGNYVRDHGYLAGVAWFWATCLLVATLSAAASLTAGVIAWSWPNPPVWALTLLERTPLLRLRGASRDDAVRHRLGIAWATVSPMLVVVAFVVAILPGIVSGTDTRFANAIAGWDLPDLAADVARLGSAGVVLGVALLALVLGRRCTVYVVAYLGAVGITYVAWFLIEVLVARQRPLGVLLTGTTTFPSLEVAQATVVAMLLPLAVRRARGARAVPIVLALVLWAATLVVATSLVHERRAWPTDVFGGVLLGAGVALAATWVLWHPEWHAACAECSWMLEPRAARRGLVVMSDEWSRGLQRVAISCTFIVVGTFVFLATTRGIPETPDGSMIGTAVAQPVQIGLMVLMAVGAAVAFRWRAVGATIVALAGLLLAVLSAFENPPIVAIVISLAALAPAVALWASWQRSQTHGRIWALAFGATVMVTLGFFGASNVYGQYFGSTHPASALPLLPVDGVEWAWSGGVTASSATVVARLDFGSRRAHLELRPGTTNAPLRTTSVAIPEDRIVRLHATGLTASTRYRWQVVVDGVPDASRGHGVLRTTGLGAESFTVVASACTRTGSDGKVFDAMRATRPDLVLFSGDLHYQNIDVDEVDAFLDAYDRVLTQPAPAALLRAAPVAYVWDDHDYGPNDADASSPSRRAARAAYRKSVPYSAPGSVGPPAQAFSVGRVRFIVTDQRSHRTATTMLGERQLDWFLHELSEASRTHELVVWVSSVPWIERARAGADGWGRYPDERRRIADAIVTERIGNLLMVAGDAHMLAIDDGSHADYSTSGGGGFPVFQAAALDRPGSAKGGPYSEGAHPGGGQFGVLRVQDDGHRLSVALEGRDWRGRIVTKYRFTPDAPLGGDPTTA